MKKFVIFVLLFPILFPGRTLASSLTALSDTVSNHTIGQSSDHIIKFTTGSGVGTGQTITITFASGFNLSTVDYGDIDVSWGPALGTEVDLTLASSPSGTTWGAAISGQTLTLTSDISTINAGSKVIVSIGTNTSLGGIGIHQITNPGVAGTYVTTIAGSFGDGGRLATAILTNDQIPVTGLVDPILTATFSSLTTSFGSLSPAAVVASTPNIDLTISTNASFGYAVSVQDKGDSVHPGLYNSSSDYLIGSSTSAYANSATLVAGTEGYGFQAASSTATIASPYGTTGSIVGGYKRTPQLLASFSGVTPSPQTITITHKASISLFTVSGYYFDTISYFISGSF